MLNLQQSPLFRNTPYHPAVDDLPTLTSTFLDSAAALETRLLETERRVQVLTHDLHRAQDQHARARRWIVLLRCSHRRASHAATGRMFKQALDHLTALENDKKKGSTS